MYAEKQIHIKVLLFLSMKQTARPSLWVTAKSNVTLPKVRRQPASIFSRREWTPNLLV